MLPGIPITLMTTKEYNDEDERINLHASHACNTLRKVKEKNGQAFYGYLIADTIFAGVPVYYLSTQALTALAFTNPVGISIAAGCIAVSTVGILTYSFYERPPDKEKKQLQQSEIENMNGNSKILFNRLQNEKNLKLFKNLRVWDIISIQSRLLPRVIKLSMITNSGA